MSSKSAQKYLSGFVDIGQINVWSLVVTAIGDLTREDGALSGAQLNALFQVMSIKPEALRVALHRLSKEKWIVSERSGRTSEYRLSSSGIAETKKVWDRVYLPDYGLGQRWHTIIVPDGLSKADPDAIKLISQAYLVKESTLLENSDALSSPFQSDSAPDWVEKRILAEGFDELSQLLLTALQQFPGFDAVDKEIEKVAIRILCVHHWRRIALRDASWLHLQYYKNGRIRKCHDLTHGLLEELPRDDAKAFIERY